MAPAKQTFSNIGPKARRLRAIMGVFSLGLALVLWSWLTFLAVDINFWLRLLCPIPPLYVGLLGILQAKRKTWVFLASRGLRDNDQGIEKIADDSSRHQTRQQGMRIMIEALVGTVLILGGATLLVEFAL